MADLNDNGIEEQFDSLETLEIEQPQKETPVEDDLPEKYKGKTAKEIVAMHQEAEKLIGKQGSEVGELRKVVDDFIKAQVSVTKSTTTEAELDDDDFYTDPKKAVAKAVENHPAVKEAKQTSLDLKRNLVLQELSTKHPDFMETVQNEKFVDWIKGSKVRTELMIRAENQFDLDAADELLSSWKERTQITKQITDTAEADRKSQLSKATIPSKGNIETSTKKIYRRSDIIDLMQRNPEKYRALSDEILKAYAEGRVK
jgi:hypothetical protein